MDSRSLGLVIVALGAAAVVIGLLVAAGALRWFGNLPGDLRYQGRNVQVYAPIVSMLLISLLLSLAFAVFNRLR